MLWMLLAIVIGVRGTNHEEVDLIELNHKLSESGAHQFDQVILWKWSPDYRRFNVQHWFIPRDPSEYPAKAGELYQCFGFYHDQKRILIRSKMFRETWTTHDPERENTRLFPTELRRRERICER